MAKKRRESAETTGDGPESVRAAGEELGRSLWQLGLTIASSPMRLLPEETQRHLRAAGREAVLAGIVLNRYLLEVPERVLAKAQARLDEVEERVSRED